ncbi:Sulfatase domain-containing protein [Caenorhabditis elegans]|nr:Sulfatase domain-containing protein [Caenorhabditis elegans]CCA65684.1 Sulfatase domain-containing protein [Caenorhabditis elegans]|eukprot:NP_001255871.1 Uncharacterized protein CELE_Y73F8A.35 [Caenorhabditis elegans]
MDETPITKCNIAPPLTYLINGSWNAVNASAGYDCKTRCHWRKDDRTNFIGNWNSTPGPVDCEFLEAICLKDNLKVYGYMHSQIIPTPPITPKVDVSKLQQYDVTVILLDSLAHAQALRSLPRAISYMTSHMSAVVFPYVNKVGENSRSNGVPLWFGKSLEKLDKSLFDEEDVTVDWTHEYMCNEFKDNETSIFNEFRDYGYKTLLAEDWAEGTLNFPNCKGFDNPPIDHYMRPFQNALERPHHGEFITRNHLSPGNLTREHHNTLLEYLSKFMNAYPNEKKFSWIWASHLGHDSMNGFSHADNDFYNFLVKHREKLDNSFVILMGDHGPRFGANRKTVSGELEVHNPFLGISIPKALRKTTEILSLMKGNAKKLQTHYDTRATILDILKYQSTTNFLDTEILKIPGEKGFSFIRKQPDTPRNCKTMPIPIQYCLCKFNRTTESIHSDLAHSMAKALTAAVNTELENGKLQSRCIKMEYSIILSLDRLDEKFRGSILYTIVVEMKKPSNAWFKANIKMLSTGELKVLGIIERVNEYGQTAHCIKSEYHRPYCFCRNQINVFYAQDRKKKRR